MIAIKLQILNQVLIILKLSSFVSELPREDKHTQNSHSPN